MLWKLLLTLVTIVTSPFRAPVDPDQPYEVSAYGPQNWEEALRAAHALQGEDDDIRYPEEDEPSYAGINGTQYRWPGYPGKGTIPYILDAAVQKDQKLVKLIDQGIAQYEKLTCIRFVKRTNQAKYVKIIKDDRKCYSYVGAVQRPQPQPLSLGSGCEFIGTVVHELGHAIGLFHEHQRSDRDTYLNVYGQNVASVYFSNNSLWAMLEIYLLKTWMEIYKKNNDRNNCINVYGQNVNPRQIHNFNKTKPIDELKWARYDYNSIMHYGEYAFSKQPGKLKTMEAKDGKTKIKEPYEKPGLDNTDIDLVKKLYKCK